MSHFFNARIKMKKYVIYIALFRDGAVYVGLTSNFEQRKKKHLSDRSSPIKQYIYQTGLTVKFYQVSDSLTEDKAQVVEREKIRSFRTDGFTVLNRNRGGSIGRAYEKWTFNNVQNEASKYNTKSTFYKCSPSAYMRAHNEGWMEKVCQHMVRLKRPSNWTKELLIYEARKYNLLKCFRDFSGDAYHAAKKYGVLNDISSHMRRLRMPNGYWTKDRCALQASMYMTRGQFQAGCVSAYRVSLNNGWLDEFFPESSVTKE